MEETLFPEMFLIVTLTETVSPNWITADVKEIAVISKRPSSPVKITN